MNEDFYYAGLGLCVGLCVGLMCYQTDGSDSILLRFYIQHFNVSFCLYRSVDFFFICLCSKGCCSFHNRKGYTQIGFPRRNIQVKNVGFKDGHLTKPKLISAGVTSFPPRNADREFGFEPPIQLDSASIPKPRVQMRSRGIRVQIRSGGFGCFPQLLEGLVEYLCGPVFLNYP